MAAMPDAEMNLKVTPEIVGYERPDGFAEVITTLEFPDGSRLEMTMTGPGRTPGQRRKLLTRLHAAQSAALGGSDD